MSPDTSLVDVAIVGGGPAGMQAALVLARCRRKVILIDSSATSVPHKKSPRYMYVTRDGVTKQDFTAHAQADLTRYPTVEIIRKKVSSMNGEQGRFVVTLDSGTQLVTRTIILATGLIPEDTGITGFTERFGHEIIHCTMCHGYEVTGHNIAVVGLRPGAAFVAQYLRNRFDADVTFLTHGNALGPAEHHVLAAAGIPSLDKKVTAISGGDGQALTVHLEQGESLFVDTVFAAPVLRLGDDLAERTGVALTANGRAIVVDKDWATSVPGIYACGDAAEQESTHPHKFITVSAASGQLAAVAVEEELYLADLATASTPVDSTPS